MFISLSLGSGLFFRGWPSWTEETSRRLWYIYIANGGNLGNKLPLSLFSAPPDSLCTREPGLNDSGAEVAESIHKTETKAGAGLISSSLLFQPFRNLAHHRYWVPGKPIGKQAQAMAMPHGRRIKRIKTPARYSSSYQLAMPSSLFYRLL